MDAAAQALVSAAYEKGSDDNITAAVAEIAADMTPLEAEALGSEPDEVVGPGGSGRVQEMRVSGGEAEQREEQIFPVAAMGDPAPGPRPLQVGPREVGFGSRPPVVGGGTSEKGPYLATVLKGLVLVIVAVALYLLFG